MVYCKPWKPLCSAQLCSLFTSLCKVFQLYFFCFSNSQFTYPFTNQSNSMLKHSLPSINKFLFRPGKDSRIRDLVLRSKDAVPLHGIYALCCQQLTLFCGLCCIASEKDDATRPTIKCYCAHHMEVNSMGTHITHMNPVSTGTHLHYSGALGQLWGELVNQQVVEPYLTGKGVGTQVPPRHVPVV